ncbi:hypothetical protein ASZ90_019699 [hydrocarbon metagenome]|uniref:Uncharacterized protein n=1 Tax=hydrocarbon metagenome TaxID=938273 RepID=A0A0W8E2R7_9ZZZZ
MYRHRPASSFPPANVPCRAPGSHAIMIARMNHKAFKRIDMIPVQMLS